TLFPLSLHDALPISPLGWSRCSRHHTPNRDASKLKRCGGKPMIRGIVRNPLIAGLPLEMSCREPSILRIDCSDSHDAPEGNGIPRPTPSMAHRRIVCHWQGESDRQENGYDARRDPP